MRTLIFEGIATSGKSTVIKELVHTLPTTFIVRVVGEGETHVPIMNQREGLHIKFFEALMNKLVSNKSDLILVDRLYMTQAFRARCSLDVYKNLEDFLLQFDPTTIFLKINEEEILSRIQKTTEHREPEWAEYVKSKGEERQIADYYINQQLNQLKLLETSLIPYKIFDTTERNNQTIIEELIGIIQQSAP